MKNDFMVAFEELTPKMKIGQPKLPELYEKAYIASSGDFSEKYCFNTAAWD